MFGMLNVVDPLASTKRYVWPQKPIIALFRIKHVLLGIGPGGNGESDVLANRY